MQGEVDRLKTELEAMRIAANSYKARYENAMENLKAVLEERAEETKGGENI